MNDSTKKIALWTAGGVLALLVLLTILTAGGTFGVGWMMYGPGNAYGPGNGPGGMMGGSFGSWWMLIPVLLLGGLLALIAWTVARIFPSDRLSSGGIPRDAAEETVRQRFARGELDGEEYERSLRTLRDGVEPGTKVPTSR